MNKVEQVKDCATPEEMRAELFRMRQHNFVVSRVIDLADFKGLSAEDKYTMLAYYSLKSHQELYEKVLNYELSEILSTRMFEPRG